MKPRFEILNHSRDDDSYMYSYSSFTFHVCSGDFGDELCRFSGSEDSDRGGTRESGVQSVRIDGDQVVATDSDGKEERVELPVKLELAGGGKAIVLTFADGRVETRPRKECVAFTKYGEPFSLKKLVLT